MIMTLGSMRCFRKQLSAKNFIKIRDYPGILQAQVFIHHIIVEKSKHKATLMKFAVYMLFDRRYAYNTE